jgi:hypothetical protein
MSEPPELLIRAGRDGQAVPPTDQPHRGQRQKHTPAIMAAHSQNQERQIIRGTVAVRFRSAMLAHLLVWPLIAK